jgi:hypothetical protein
MSARRFYGVWQRVDVGPRLVFSNPNIRESVYRPSGQAHVWGTLDLANQPKWPSAKADANFTRVEVSFYRADTLTRDVEPFTARWASSDWPQIGQAIPISERTLRSTGDADAIDFLVSQGKHSPLFWWNNFSANNLFDTNRLLPFDDYFIRFVARAHDTQEESWLRLTRPVGDPLPVLVICGRPDGVD